MIRKLVTPDLTDEQSYHDPGLEGRSDLIECPECQISLDSHSRSVFIKARPNKTLMKSATYRNGRFGPKRFN